MEPPYRLMLGTCPGRTITQSEARARPALRALGSQRHGRFGHWAASPLLVARLLRNRLQGPLPLFDGHATSAEEPYTQRSVSGIAAQSPCFRHTGIDRGSFLIAQDDEK
jgi:hypothetical protein